MKTAAKLCGFEIENYTKKMSTGTFREGFYIHLKDTEGNSSTGEVAPFLGRSLESLDSAYSNILKIKDNFLNNSLSPSPLYPSVMFGMQMALYSIQNKPQKLNNPVSALYYDPPSKKLEGKVKLKMGSLSVEEAIGFYLKVASSRKVKICIDLERKWDITKTVLFCSQVDTRSILYIEDPVTNYSDLENFYNTTGVMYAIDIFLSFQPPEEIKKLKGLHSVIIKPTLVGGIHECSRLKDVFNPIPISFSSLFETSIGIDHIRLIASILCPEEYVGVDTLKFFPRR